MLVKSNESFNAVFCLAFRFVSETALFGAVVQFEAVVQFDEWCGAV